VQTLTSRVMLTDRNFESDELELCCSVSLRVITCLKIGFFSWEHSSCFLELTYTCSRLEANPAMSKKIILSLTEFKG
jgi:hypothetical protein